MHRRATLQLTVNLSETVEARGSAMTYSKCYKEDDPTCKHGNVRRNEVQKVNM